MHMVAPRYWTADMVRALPDDGQRYEVVFGELLVSPSPRPLHQLVLGRLQRAVLNYLDREPVGAYFASPADISWSQDTLVQPDLFVVDPDEARTLDWTRMQRLLLACEVMSPSSVRADRFSKRVLYQRQLIAAYWVVDPDAGSVEVWTPESPFPVVEERTLTWHPAGATAPLVITLDELFAPL